MVNLKGEITITNEYMPNNRASKHKEKKIDRIKGRNSQDQKHTWRL